MYDILVRILLFTSCSTAVIFLREPGNVTRTYQPGSTMEGNFFMDCELNSLLSDQKVSWFKQGEIISDNYTFRSNVNHLVDGDRYILVAPEQSRPLRFQMAVLSVSFSTAVFDSGSYQCAVTWLNDTVLLNGRSRTAVVNINDAHVLPIQPICKISDISGDEITVTSPVVVTAGDHLLLTCFPDSLSTTNAMLFWSGSHENGLLSVSQNVSTDGVVSITYFWIPSWDDGPTWTFTCTLQHPGLSSDRICSISFNIQYAPKVTIDPADVMVTEENDEIVLQCNQDANPQVTESVWYYDDDVVNSGGRFRLEGMSLRILISNPQENGDHNITCQLTNVIGTGTGSVILTVNIPFPSTIKPRSLRFSSQEFPRSQSTANGDIDVPCPQSCQCEQAPINRTQTGTISIWLGVGLLFIGTLGGVLSTSVICFLLYKYGRTPWRYGNNSNIENNARSRDGMELKASDNLGMNKETDEQNYQVIQKTDSTAVDSNDESVVKGTDTAIHANVFSNKIEITSEDEHYQSLGKQNESLYAGLTTDNKI